MIHFDKVYVAVIAAFDESGKLKPRRVKWEDGSTYTKDRILDVRPAAAHKAGGQGDAIQLRSMAKKAISFLSGQQNRVVWMLEDGLWSGSEHLIRFVYNIIVVYPVLEIQIILSSFFM